MHVLVTGGTGVVGESTATALLQRRHVVRLLPRHGDREAKQWPYGVAAWPGDVSSEASVRGAAEGCEGVVHLAAVGGERPPEITHERVNVQGTRNVVREAERVTFTWASAAGGTRSRAWTRCGPSRSATS